VIRLAEHLVVAVAVARSRFGAHFGFRDQVDVLDLRGRGVATVRRIQAARDVIAALGRIFLRGAYGDRRVAPDASREATGKPSRRRRRRRPVGVLPQAASSNASAGSACFMAASPGLRPVIGAAARPLHGGLLRRVRDLRVAAGDRFGELVHAVAYRRECCIS
jgi:hypothetical protein